MAHLACLDEFGHRADGLFNRCIPIDAMLIIQVNAINIQTLERAFARRAYVVRSTANTASLRIAGIAQDTELGRDKDLIAATGDRLADQDFIGKGSVHVRRIEKIEAERDPACITPIASASLRALEA